MMTLEKDEQLNKLISEDRTILVFSADWCPDCRIIEPIFPELESRFSEWTFVYVDRDQFIHVCQDYDVFGIPSFVAIEKGNEVGRMVSKERKTKEEIVSFISGLEEKD